MADGRVKGVHYLMKKNKITEFDGWGTFTDATTLHVRLHDGGSARVFIERGSDAAWSPDGKSIAFVRLVPR